MRRAVTSIFPAAPARSRSITIHAGESSKYEIPETSVIRLVFRRRRRSEQPSQLTAYMLVNNGDDLQAVGSSLTSLGRTRTRWARASARPASPGTLPERRSPDCSTAMAASAPVPRSAILHHQRPQPLLVELAGRAVPVRRERRDRPQSQPGQRQHHRHRKLRNSRRSRRREPWHDQQRSYPQRQRQQRLADGRRSPAVWSDKTRASSPTPARPPLSASEIPIPRPPRILRAGWLPPISGPSRTRRRAAT